MRRFGLLGTLTVLGLLVGCGGSDGKGTDGGGPGGTSSTGRDPLTGQCIGASDEVCTGEDAYLTCLVGKCDAQLKPCYGSDYTQRKYSSGACADFMNCEMKCPCDATKDACEASCMAQHADAVTSCLSCTATVAACIAGSGCAEPVCTSATSTLTSTATMTSTSTSTATGSCAAALACCQSLGPSLGAAVVQQCQALVAGQTDATCAQAIATYKAYCP
jgi:hypothetical protein